MHVLVTFSKNPVHFRDGHGAVLKCPGGGLTEWEEEGAAGRSWAGDQLGEKAKHSSWHPRCQPAGYGHILPCPCQAKRLTGLIFQDLAKVCCVRDSTAVNASGV